MGCGMSQEAKEQQQKNLEIEQALRREKAALKNEIKMLLLGKSAPSFTFVFAVDNFQYYIEYIAWAYS
jgi:hypothetical protein